jgi:hypothetical protein
MSSLLHLTIKCKRTGFHHPSALPNDQGGGPGLLHARVLPAADKHRPFWVSGDVDFKHWPQWNVAVGTHAHLALCTKV